MKTIVIVGSSFSGVYTAHRLLKQAPKTGDIKIILVGQSTHIYWNLATPRAILAGQFPDNKIFGAIAPGFKKYGNKFEFVVGTAESLNTESKNVVVATTAGQKTISYDYVILATGARSKGDAPWKQRESYEATLAALHDFQARVKKASSIVVGGAGATGVETAGELGFEYGKTKNITLISSGPVILEGTPSGVTNAATNKLREFKVNLKLSTKINGEAKLPDGRTELSLSDGSKLITDLYLSTTGVIPNSSYVPNNLLNANGYVVVDEYLRAKGTSDVWAVGDISSVQRPQFVHLDKQSALVTKNIGLLMQGKDLVKFPTNQSPVLAVPLGRKAGTGHMGSWKLPSFMIVRVKGKTYLTQNLAPVIDGSAA
ncbi:Pestheic acid biosynthesis cluster L [Hyphodiscus hymeniophilus]|uniref:Pestheic acid biosynthesis cluster L n=1 Tax=Hyphodiscus hymeniophilus TaxID=353542 RepID=A0A9P6VCM4_9HELO|nr:Pestheic acid biosynthesis cluster L [Hyphodiscus hymeniophilus]